MKEKLLQTLGIMFLVAFATACFLPGRNFPVDLITIYVISLLAMLFWPMETRYIPLAAAVLAPIIEILIISLYLEVSPLGPESSSEVYAKFSTFFRFGGWPGYVLFCLVFPTAAYFLAGVWEIPNLLKKKG